MRIRLHYNKFKAKFGLPWTLHTSKRCFIASHVLINVPVETEEHPDKKTNPRYFLKCDGDIHWTGTKAIIA
jgi:hypothetical protein